jgi:hypothetical protein
MTKYSDDDGKYFDYPPPNYSVRTYIQQEIQSLLPRGSHDNALPRWARDLQKIVSSMMDIDSPTERLPLTTASRPPPSQFTGTPKAKKQTSPSKTPRTSQLTTPRQRKCVSPDKIELEEEKENSRIKDAEIASGLHHIEELMELLSAKDDQINDLQQKLTEQSNLNSTMNERLDSLSRQKAILSYDDLRPGGRLDVKEFSYFKNFDTLDEFLNVINFADHSDESRELGGLCECLDRYSKWNRQRRKVHNDNLQTQDGVSTLSGDEYSDDDGSDSEDDAHSHCTSETSWTKEKATLED